MKSVLISINPKWCELIASGKKTVEVRKTKPKLETPFKVYIYCTKGKFEPSECLRNNLHYDDSTIKVCEGQGKVIGEFVCDKIENFRYDALEITYMTRKYRDTNLVNEEFFKGTQVTYQEAYDYCEGMTFGDLESEKPTDIFYGWHITDLVIYDEPRELSEFKPFPCKYNFDGECYYERICSKNCKHQQDTSAWGYKAFECAKKITRPPQSWCYVEDEE